MGYLFEELIRRFSEISNETAGEHFTPREVIRLIVDLLIANDDAKLTGRGIIRQVYDPACGTGGMLALTEEALKDFNPSIRVELFGQETQRRVVRHLQVRHARDRPRPRADRLRQHADPGRAQGQALPLHALQSALRRGLEEIPGPDQDGGRDHGLRRAGSGPGLPRISDGQLLFLQHMISKMRDDETGSRIGIVMNGSPLFTGGAGSGESEIRRWMLENDWVEAIVALPTELFYNTGIQTYMWLLTNRKPAARRGKVQLIDASGERFWKPMRKSLGSKRREIPDEARDEIVRIYADFIERRERRNLTSSKIFDTTDFGYREIRVERPLQLNFQASEERIARLHDEKAFRSCPTTSARRHRGRCCSACSASCSPTATRSRRRLSKAFKAGRREDRRTGQKGDPGGAVRAGRGRRHLHR